jgi:Ca2+-binding RTX toxin-like protein
MAHIVFNGTNTHSNLGDTTPALQPSLSRLDSFTLSPAGDFSATVDNNQIGNAADDYRVTGSGYAVTSELWIITQLDFGAPNYMTVTGLNIPWTVDSRQGFINTSAGAQSFLATVTPFLYGNDTAQIGGFVSQFWGDIKSLTAGQGFNYGNDSLIISNSLALAPGFSSVRIYGDGVSADAGSTFTAGNDVIDGRLATVALTLFGDFETANGSGSFGSDLLMGGSAGDFIYGDSLTTVDLPQGGDDRLFGGGGADQLFGGGGNDTLNGGDGTDVLYGGTGDDLLGGDAGADSLNGGPGFDYAVYSGSGFVAVSLASPASNNGQAAGDIFNSIEGVISGNGNDSLWGDENHNVLIGLNGNDTLFGAGGPDSLYGANGDDSLFGDASGDYLDGGLGFDYARYDFSLIGVTLDLAEGGSTGDAAGDIFAGIEGVIGTGTEDRITGDGQANVLMGKGANDILIGRDNIDSLYGGDGNDQLFGGNQQDFLFGGFNGDIFVFSGVAEALTGVDAIQDFATGVDKIGIVTTGFGVSGLNFITGAAATTPFAQFIYDPATRTLLFDPDGTGAGSTAVPILTVQGGATVAAGDIQLL